jgi:transcriptional regulator with XRE-family HTH domain
MSRQRHHPAVDQTRVGGDLRLLRHRRGWSQGRLSREAGVGRSTISAVETGRAEQVALDTLLRIATALGARLSVRIYWQGEALDRLRDRRHAALVEGALHWLAADGWLTRTEVTFSEYGERGSIDILAFHPATGALLVVEVKSVVPDLQAMLSSLDRKWRLSRTVSRTVGWHAASVSRLLVLPDDRTARRRVSRHAATFDTALPLRTTAVKRWVRSPTSPIAGILFLTDVVQGDHRQGLDGRPVRRATG